MYIKDVTRIGPLLNEDEEELRKFYEEELQVHKEIKFREDTDWLIGKVDQLIETYLEEL